MTDNPIEDMMEKNILEMTVGDLLYQVMSRGNGTLHTVLEFPDGEYENVHVAVTYGTPEVAKMHEVVQAAAQSVSKEQIVMHGEATKDGEIKTTPWMKPV